MDIFLATKTMETIKEAMEKDQGAAYRQYLKELLPQQDDAFRGETPWQRSHLGASQIGRPCPRELWFNFRWVKEKRLEARIIRLFNRGHLEEARIIAALKLIPDIKVWQLDSEFRQFTMSDFGGHYGSAIDGVIKGIPELPNEPIIAEYKTHGYKSFSKLKADGVRESKPEHFTQMNQYMGEFRLNYALYGAVNKNDDELYFEIVAFDPEEFKQYRERAEYIVFTPMAPEKINKSPSWYQCRFCDYNDVCHKKAPIEKNCRTCANVKVEQDGSWGCGHREVVVKQESFKPAKLTKEQQMKGCRLYEINPTILY